jgi:hypothetical protein
VERSLQTYRKEALYNGQHAQNQPKLHRALNLHSMNSERCCMRRNEDGNHYHNN